MDEVDYWLARGFGGIVNILHTRVTQFKVGFSARVQRLVGMEARRLAELNDAVQANPDTPHSGDCDVLCIDRWFTRAFSGLDTYLAKRCEEGPRLGEETLQLMEGHACKIMDLVTKERCK